MIWQKKTSTGEETVQKEKLKGRRCIALIRVSRARQAKNGLPQQAAWLRNFTDEHDMLWVDERKEALGVSQIKKRPDVDYLLDRKALRASKVSC